MNLEFYKDLLVIEISRKDRLDNEYSNNTSLMISVLISVNFFFFEKYKQIEMSDDGLRVIITFVLFTLFSSLLGCLFHFVKGYNNIFNGYNYLNLPNIKKVWELEKQHDIDDFNNALIEQLTNSISSYQQINIVRFKSFYNCRKMLVAFFLLTIVYISIYYIIN